MIAHRLAAAAEADQIVVLEGGAIVECGTHADLLERPGVYRTMYQRQQFAPPDWAQRRRIS
jgi:ABC-type transport system involved in Fe-S cluster assembly fused permease/ATPase subunit